MRTTYRLIARSMITAGALVAGLVTAEATAPASAATAVAAPSDVRVNSALPAPGSLSISWSGVTGARSYRATATPVSGGNPVALQTVRTTATLTGLAHGTAYRLTVQSGNGSSWSKPSSEVRANTLGAGRTYTFVDVPASSRFYRETAWLASTGVTTGYDDGTFRPSQAVLREQMAAFLYRAAGSPSVKLPRVSPYRDVSTSSRFYKEIVWLASTGVTTGYDDGTFRPSQAVLREQMAAFLYRSAGSPPVAKLPRISPYRDVSTSSRFYKETVWLASTGVTTGYDDGTFRPSQAVLREQMAAFLYRERLVEPTSVVETEPVDTTPVAPEPETPAPAEPQGPCGAEIRKADGTPWTCTFVDDFAGTALDRSKWQPLQTGVDGYSISNDCYVDSPENISVGGGTLKLTARKVAPMTCNSPHGAFPSEHTAGTISTWGLFSQTYGRFEIRARMPAGKVPGTHSAWWLFPQNPGTYGPFPASGEIDIAEYYSAWPDRAIPMLHYGVSNGGAPRTNNYCMVEDPTAFHTYTAEWTAEGITILYDGQVCLAHTWEKVDGMPLGAPFDQDYTLTLTQGIGAPGNLPTDATPFPATMEVDYVRVWS